MLSALVAEATAAHVNADGAERVLKHASLLSLALRRQTLEGGQRREARHHHGVDLQGAADSNSLDGEATSAFTTTNHLRCQLLHGYVGLRTECGAMCIVCEWVAASIVMQLMIVAHRLIFLDGAGVVLQHGLELRPSRCSLCCRQWPGGGPCLP